MAFLNIRNLSCSFNNNKILDNINIDFEKNKAIAILGNSGCGKSTFLNCIAGYVKYDGVINLNSNKGFSFVFQDSYMVNFLSIDENVKFSSILKENNFENSNKLLAKLNLKLNSKNINKVSGGEKERIGIARALYTNSDLILMDEPTGSLDEKNAKYVSDIINKLKKEKLIIFVTHDKEFAESCADEIFILDNKKLKNINKEKKKLHFYNSCQNQKYNNRKLDLKNTFKLIFKMFKTRFIKTILGISSLAFSLVLVFFILLININSNSVLDKMSKEYFNNDIYKVSKVEKIKIDDNLNLVRNIRPQIEDSSYNVLPSFDGILPSTISFKIKNKVNEIALCPSVCETQKLSSGRCPLSYNEVVINKNLLKTLGDTESINLEKSIDFYQKSDKKYAHDIISMDFSLKIVGISKESTIFNTQSMYYDYYAMYEYFSSIKLENISNLFSKPISVIDKISYISTDIDYITGYNVYIISNDFNLKEKLNNDSLEISNKALEMKQTISTLIKSLSQIANIFLGIALTLAIFLLVMFLINVFEEEKKTLGLIKSLGISNNEFFKIPFATSIVTSFITFCTSVILFFIINSLITLIVKEEYILEFIKVNNLLFLVFIFSVIFFFLSCIISFFLSQKINNDDLINCLRGEE